MAYLEDDFEGFDDERTTLLEDDDFEAWEPQQSGEAVGPRYRPNYSRGAPRTIARPKPPRPVGGLGGATINTPAGRAQMRFEKPVATKESVDNMVREVKRELAALAETVKRVDQTVDKNTSVLDKKVVALEGILSKGQQGSQMGMLLPLLLNKPPQIATIKGKVGTGAEQTATITETTYKEGDNTGMLLAILAMSGGLGGGSGSGDNSMMLILALAMSGSLGGGTK